MSEAVDAFDRAAGEYDGWYATEKGRQVFSAETRLLERLIPSVGVGLEIGAGTGVFAEALTDPRTVVCLDLSREMLARAKNRRLHCILGSAYAMPLRTGVFSFAYMVTVIEFLVEPVVSLTEASKVTSKNAPIAVLFINRDSGWGEFYAKMAEDGDPIFSHANLYTLTDIDRIGEKAGLRLQDACGTLTTNPTSAEAGDEIMEPGISTGVVAALFTK